LSDARADRRDESNRRCWPARPDLGERWPSRLVATAAENRLNIPASRHTSFAARRAIAEAVAILSDQSNREDRKKKEGFFFFFKNAAACRSESLSFS
jgi:hypothetical protein